MTLSLEALTALVDEGEIDTVVMAQVDMQGRLMGKRFHARHFLDSAVHETHSFCAASAPAIVWLTCARDISATITASGIATAMMLSSPIPTSS